MPNKNGEPTESEIQAQIIKALRWKGWFCFKIHQSLGSYKGVADIYACKAGRSVWIEVKTPKGRQSDYQKDFEKDVNKQGIEYVVVRDVNDVMGL